MNRKTLLLKLFFQSRYFLTVLTMIAYLIPGQSAWSAGNQSIGYRLPDSLKMTEALKRSDYIVLEGYITVTGRYEFIYEQGDDGQPREGEVPTLHIYPDSLINLPTFLDRGKPVKKMIFTIQNVKAAANMIFGRPKTEKLYEGRYPSMTGKAVFVLEGLTVTYNQCNQLSFISDVSRVDRTLEEMSIGEAKKHPGC